MQLMQRNPYSVNVGDYIKPALEREAEKSKLQAMNYQNLLAEQMLKDREDADAGYAAAYQHSMRGGQPQPQQTVNALMTPEGQAGPRLDLHSEQAPQEGQAEQGMQPQQPQPFAAPEGSSAAYIKGAQAAEQAFQQQQYDYYTNSIAPLMNLFIENGMDNEYQALITQLQATNNPIAGFAKQFTTLLEGSSIPRSNEITDIKMNDQTREVLKLMAGDNPAIAAAVEGFDDGDVVSVKMKNDQIVSIGGASESGIPRDLRTRMLDQEDERLRLKALGLGIREDEMTAKYDPDLKARMGAAGKEGEKLGENITTYRNEEAKQANQLSNLRQLYRNIDDPDVYGKAFGELSKATEIFARYLPQGTPEEKRSKWRNDSALRAKLQTEVAHVMSNDLKSMFGPPFSDNDIKHMFMITGANLGNKDAFKKVVGKVLREKEIELNSTRQNIARFEKLRSQQAPTKADGREFSKSEMVNMVRDAVRSGKSFFMLNGTRFDVIKQPNGSYTARQSR